MSTVVEDLKRIRARVDRGWAQGTFARDADGEKTPCFSPRAACWCIMGAWLVEDASEKTHDVMLDFGLSPKWNDADGMTKEAVLEKLDELIAVESEP